MTWKILAGSVPLVGHLAPMMPLARRLQDDGQQVEFLSHPRMRDALDRRGLSLRDDFAWGGDTLDIIERNAVEGGVLWHLIKERKLVNGFYFFVYGLEEGVRDCLRILDQQEPDVCFFDILFFPGILAAEVRGIPYALSCPVPSPLASRDLLPYSLGMPSGQKTMSLPQRLMSALSDWYWGRNTRYVNRVREIFSLPPMTDIVSGCISPYLYLSYTTELFEDLRSDLPQQVHYIGPTLTPRSPETEESFPWSQLDDRPLVYFTMGTLQGNRKIYDRVIEASTGAPWQLVVALGKLFHKEDFPSVPENVLLVNWAPQTAILEKADAMVCHGGFNTINDALAAGVPLLVLPQAWDHFESAQRIVESGAGLRLDPGRASTARIRRETQRLLEDPAKRRAAERLAKDFSTCDAARTGAELISKLAKTRAPVFREARE